MRMRSRIIHLKEERGQILVVAVFLIMTFILLVGVVADVGNWFVHRRHLQTQVDAAALAAGGKFRDCFFNQTAANTAIKTVNTMRATKIEVVVQDDFV